MQVARAVLGRLLVRVERGGVTAGRIVEVEAYRGRDDPASHAYRGVTPRTSVMFGRPGHAYVYFTYGMHHCLNLVVQPAGQAAAVLIRALEPLAGLARMTRRRGGVEWARLTRGPGCVAQAMGLDRRHDGLDLVSGPLWVSDRPAERGRMRVERGPRIGIRVGHERPWRFFLSGHSCVSGPRRARAAVPGGRGRQGRSAQRVPR